MTIYWHFANSKGLTEATAEIRLEKENFETYLDQSGQSTITHEQWEQVAEDIDGTLENSADEIMARIADLIKRGVYFEGENEGVKNGNE
jgi:AcrR family transcriptional regulator